MRILVIGANGFFGRHIVHEVINQKHSVIAVYHTHHDNIPKEVPKLPLSKIHTVQLDPSDCIMLASGNYRMNWNDLLHVNVLLPLNIHMLFPKNKLVFISSILVHNVETVITEKTVVAPTGVYGISKAMGEAVVSSFPIYSIIRFTSLYGVGMQRDLFIPTIVRSVKTHSHIVLFGDGTRKQNYLHVSDAARLCCAAIHHTDSGIFLGADTTSYTNTDVAHFVAKQKKNVHVVYTGKDVAPSIHIDAHHTRKQLSWYPQMSLSDGLKEFYEKT